MDSPSFFVTLDEIIKEFNLENVLEMENLKDIKVESADVNRPGLQIIGFLIILTEADCK